MTMKEREERIEALKNRLFMLNMIDRTTYNDRLAIEAVERELRELRKLNK